MLYPEMYKIVTVKIVQRLFTFIFLIWIQSSNAYGTNFLDQQYEAVGFGFGNDLHLLSSIRHSNSPVIQKGLLIRDEIAKANYDEIKTLIQLLKKAVVKSKLGHAEILAKTKHILNFQKDIINELYVNVGTNKGYPFIFRYELNKIAKRDIYTRSSELLTRQEKTIFRGVLMERPKQGQIVELKYALIHAVKAIDPNIDLFEFMQYKKLFYPVSIPVEVRSKFKDFLFFDLRTGILWLPNAGYMIAADPIAGKLRGTDCSGFISLIFNTTAHLSTKDFQDIWKIKKNLITKDKVSPIVQNEISNYFVVGQKDLQPGDLVIWRWMKGTETFGHIAIFAGWRKKYSTFTSLEVAMIPNQNLDGAGCRELEVDRANADLSILRRAQS